MEKEIWKDIKDYEGLYQVSNMGRVKSMGMYTNRRNGKRFVKGRILKQASVGRGYLKVNLCKDGIHTNYYVHRLVAETFIPNPNNYNQVNHKTENKHINSSEALEWCTCQYNNTYGTAVERRAKKHRKYAS